MTYEDRCEMCNDVVHTYEFDGGYGEHSYNHKTVKEYEDRRISLPEREDELTVKVCMECQKKEPSLHSLIKRKRIEWFIEKIQNKKLQIKQTKKQIKTLELSIPKTIKTIQKLRERKKEIEK